MTKSVNKELVDAIYQNLIHINKIEEILGLTIICYDGNQPLVFSPDEAIFEYLKTLGEIISSMEPISYFKNLPRNFEYHGIGHLNFDDFDLFFVKIASNLLLTIITSISTNTFFKTCQNFSDQLYDVFKHHQITQNKDSAVSLTTSLQGKLNEDIGTITRFNKDEEVKKPKKSKTQSKSDLKRLLREKLDRMSNK
ncbi:MAG: hypothetical protein ACC656_11935 [Candidatus Heimdallarchaeota archaeon]